MKNTNDFAVRRGRTFTTFSTSIAAAAYQNVTLGSVLMVRTASGWKNLF